MPIYDIACPDCRYTGEVLVMPGSREFACPSCGGHNAVKQMSATSTLTGQSPQRWPGPADTACCGSRPGEPSGCSGPGSCCGKD